MFFWFWAFVNTAQNIQKPRACKQVGAGSAATCLQALGFCNFLKAKAQDVPPDTRLRPSVQSPLCFPLQSSLPPHPLLPFPCNSSFPSHSLSLKIWCVPPDTRLRPSVQSPVPFPLKSSFPLHPLSLKFGVPHPTLDNALPFEVLFPFHSSTASHSIP